LPEQVPTIAAKLLICVEEYRVDMSAKKPGTKAFHHQSFENPKHKKAHQKLLAG